MSSNKRPFKTLKDNFKRDDKQAYLFALPYTLLFITFIVIPIIIAMFLSTTSYDMVSMPKFIGANNFIYLLTSDNEFMKYILPNTIKFSILVGPIGYILAFILAWCLAQLPGKLRTVLDRKSVV